MKVSVKYPLIAVLLLLFFVFLDCMADTLIGIEVDIVRSTLIVLPFAILVTTWYALVSHVFDKRANFNDDFRQH